MFAKQCEKKRLLWEKNKCKKTVKPSPFPYAGATMQHRLDQEQLDFLEFVFLRLLC